MQARLHTESRIYRGHAVGTPPTAEWGACEEPLGAHAHMLRHQQTGGGGTGGGGGGGHPLGGGGSDGTARMRHGSALRMLSQNSRHVAIEHVAMEYREAVEGMRTRV